MKIGVVSFLFNSNRGGGSEIAAQQTVQGLLEHRHEVFIITTHGSRKLSLNIENELRVYRLPPRNLYWVANKDKKNQVNKILWQLLDVWNPGIYHYVRNILRYECPDIVHSHKIRGLSSSIWSAAYSLNIPNVHTTHDYEAFSPIGHLVGKLGQMSREGIGLFSLYQATRRRVSSYVSGYSAPSKFTMDMHINRGFFQRAIKDVIPNSHGMNSIELSAISANLQINKQINNQIRFLFLGRLDTIKGIDLLLESFVECAAEHKEIHLDIVGGGGDLETEMRLKYMDHPNIHFHGPAYGDQKSKLLFQADILAMPVTNRPAVFGTVVVEAYAYGLPIISSYVGGIPEVVENGVTGLLVPPEDKNALVQAMNALIENPDLIETMRRNCLLQAKKYTVEVVSQRYLDLYNTILA